MSSPEEASQGSCCGGSERAWIDPLEACSLSSDQLSERSEWIRHEIAPQVLGRRRLKDGLALEVVASPGMSERVDEWLEMERDCCGSIDWARRPSETAGQIRIEIRGVDPEGPLFAALPFLEPGEVPDVSRTGALSRVFKAGAAGSFLSFLVCCVLPYALVSLLGASALGASLVWLDDPLWIGLGTVLGGVGAWFWMKRRARTKSA